MSWLTNWREHPSLEDRWMALAYGIAGRLGTGELTIIAPDGTSRTFRGGDEGPRAQLKIHHARAIRQFATGGSLGFAEAYLNGDWDSPDLGQALGTFGFERGSLHQ